MSEALIIGRGGGSGLSTLQAVIHVTAEAGSTISFAKGGVTAKVLGPEKAHISAADSSRAEWYYAVSASNYGAWTVTATRGTDSASTTVTVSANQQYDLELGYTLWLYRRGDKMVSVTGGWEASTNAPRDGGRNTPRVTDNSDSMLVSYVNTGMLETVNKVDLSNVSTICLTANFAKNTGWFGISARTEKIAGASGQTSIAAQVNIQSQIVLNTEKTYSLDVSSLTGAYYVGLHEWADGSETCRVTISEVYGVR